MPNYNKLILVGHLARDPEMVGKGNMPICKCGIAVTHKRKDREDVCFLDFVVFGKQAETFQQYCTKGKAVLIEGRLQLEQWEDKQGQKRSRHSMVCESFQFIGGKEGGGKAKDGEFPNLGGPVDEKDLPF